MPLTEGDLALARCLIEGCEATFRTPGGLTNLAASYADGPLEWRCEAHMPPSWPGRPARRLSDADLTAVAKWHAAQAPAAPTAPPRVTELPDEASWREN